MTRSFLALCVLGLALHAPSALARQHPKTLRGFQTHDAPSAEARADDGGGRLVGEGPRVRDGWLLGRPPALLLAQAEGEEEAAPSGATRAELEAEYRELEESAPSIGGPIALTAVGGVVGFLGFFYWFIFSSFAGSNGAVDAEVSTLLTAFLAVAVIGGAMAVLGIVLLVTRIRGRVARSQRMNELREELRSLPAEQPAGPGYVPPSVRWGAPPALVTVARF